MVHQECRPDVHLGDARTDSSRQLVFDEEASLIQRPETTVTWPLKAKLLGGKSLAGLLVAGFLLGLCHWDPLLRARHKTSSKFIPVNLQGWSNACMSGSDGDAAQQIRWHNHPDMCLTVPAAQAGNGTLFHLDYCDSGSHVDHEFLITEGGGKIKLAADPRYCLDVKDHLSVAGNSVQLWECIDADSDQTFVISSAQKGRLHWASHRGKCIDVKDHIAEPGTAIQIWDCLSNDTDQLFSATHSCRHAHQPEEQQALEGIVSLPVRKIFLVNHPDLCFSVPAAQAQNGTLLRLDKCDDSSPSDNRFLFSAGGSQIQLASNRQLCLDATTRGISEIRLSTCSGEEITQIFSFPDKGTGKIKWSSQDGKCLHVKHDPPTSGNNILISECLVNNSNQVFSSVLAHELVQRLPTERPHHVGHHQELPPTQIRWLTHPNFCISTPKGAFNGSAVKMMACEDRNSADLEFLIDGRGKIRLASNPDNCVGIRGLGTNNGNTLQVWTCADGDPAQDLSSANSNGSKIHWRRHLKKCLDVKDHKAVDGAIVQIWDCLPFDQDQKFFAETSLHKKFTTTTTTFIALEGVSVLQSSPDSFWRELRVAASRFEEDGHPTIDVDTTSLGQTIVGFGGALTESSAVVFKGLSMELQNQLIEWYYSDGGLNYNLGRIHINSCDFSTSSYSFDDMHDDFNLDHFDRNVSGDQHATIPLIKKAQDRVRATGKELKLLASPWSPPGWMKTNGKMVFSGSPGLRRGCRDVWARYIAEWVTAYKLQGIPIWAITIQNEPLANSSWDACMMDAGFQAQFLAHYLGPTMKSSHPDVGIFAYDHNKDKLVSYSESVISNAQAAGYLTGVAFHWYAGDHFDAVRRLRDRFPQFLLLPSEATYEKYRLPGYLQGSLANDGDISLGLGYAHDILGNLNAGGVGWIDWNILLDTSGGPNHVGNTCDAAIIADTKLQKLWRHPQFYYIGHFSKFLTSGSKVAETTITGSRTFASPGVRPYGTCNDGDGLEATSAVRSDGKLVVVVLNCGNFPQTFKLRINKQTQVLRGRIPAKGIESYLIEARLISN